MPSSLVTVLLTAAAVLVPAAFIQGRPSRRSGGAPAPQPFPTGFARGAYRAGPGLRAPALQHTARPRYPAEVSPPIPADVEVLAVIDEDGDVTARVLVAPEPREPFEREAIAAVRKYVFEPGAIGDTPVPVVVTLLVPFRTPAAPITPLRIVGGTADPPAGVSSRLTALAGAPGPGVIRPLPVSKVYPEVAPEIYARVSGRVGMLAVLNADGLVEDLEVTRPLAPGIDGPAVDAVRRWVFEPAMRDGRAVPVLVSVFVSVNETP